ncbi:hypothetical protein D1007_34501 [Hordeum vulgare]|nr:hypothetical protein D1007_34501 [Hordeum vulgare]
MNQTLECFMFFGLGLNSCMCLPNWSSVCLCSRSFTFVRPVFKEGSVGDRMVYGNLLAFLNNVMWAMYAASGSPHTKLFFFIVSGMGFVSQISYAVVYIYFSEGQKQFKALVLLSASCVLALIVAALVTSEVMTQRWSGTWVHVLAAASALSIHMFSSYDMVSVAGGR